MKNRTRVFGLASVALLSVVAAVDAATYRLVPSEAQVLPGTTIGLTAEVETEAGDNVVGIGYFSFALDLTLTGTAGATADDISSILINEMDFDDLLNNSPGFPLGNQYLGIAAVTTDIFLPTFGHNVGDVTWLFGFDLVVPLTAGLGDTITITPSEGALENLIADDSFANVTPQIFQPATLTVVPEPTSLLLLTLGAGVFLGVGRQRGSTRRTLVKRTSGMRTVFFVVVSSAFISSCGPLIGFVSPDEIEYRFLKLWNRSKGYVVFRLTSPDADPLVTSALPPGGQFNGEVVDLFGTLCPDVLKVEIFAFARANPQQSALEDETLVPTPFASAVVELRPGADYGCRADESLITLGGSISCDVLELDESASAIGFDADGSLQRQEGLQADDPPTPRQPERFALTGRVVNLNSHPIPNVEIRLLDLNESVFTDSEGRFAIQRPIGSYMLEAIVPDVQVAPGAPQRYAHRDPSDLPIEFLALTDIIPQLSLPNGVMR